MYKLQCCVQKFALLFWHITILLVFRYTWYLLGNLSMWYVASKWLEVRKKVLTHSQELYEYLWYPFRVNFEADRACRL